MCLNVFCLKRLYCFTVFCQCIDIKLTFKGKCFFLKIAAIGEHHACFLSLSYYHYATYHIKITSYRKFATAIWQYKMFSNVAEDLRIVFLHSNLIWQVSCAGSNTKAHAEISSWSIYYIKCQYYIIIQAITWFNFNTHSCLISERNID